jgi:hypothetical protein
MATITSAQSGDFSDTATWVGGVVPTVGDIAVAANGHVVAIDTDVTLTRVTQLGTGKFTLGGGRTLTADVEAVSGSFTSGGTVEVTATSGSTAYIIGNVTGLSSTAVNICGVNVTGTGTLQLTGNVTSSAGTVTDANLHAAIYTNTTCTIDVNGEVSGGPSGAQRKNGILCDTLSNATVLVTGNLIGRAVANYAVHLRGVSSSVTVIGNVTSSGGGFNQAPYAIQATGSNNSVTVTGDVTAGSANDNAIAINMTGSAASCTVTGNVTATNTTSYGVGMSGASATITITGDVTGGSGANAHGAYASGASSFIDVTGTIAAAGTTSHGVRSDATTAGFGVRLAGDMVDTQGGVVAVWTRFLRIVSTAPSGVTQYANDASFPTGGTVSFVSPDNVTGMPSASDVRGGLSYGYNNELEGTMAVPPSSSVVAGVPVDDGVGLAALTPDEMWNYLSSSATTPNSLGAILANITSLLRDDAIEQIITFNRDNNSTLTLDNRTFNINTSVGAYPIVCFGEEV